MVNAHEIRVFALRRSGHHGLLHWLRGHFTGEVRLQNNVSILAAGDSHAYNVSADKGDSRDAFIFNVENPDLETVERDLRENSWQTHQGTSQKIHNILFLRDPYNRLASRIAAWSRDTKWGDTIQREMLLWKQSAREFLGKTRLLPPGTLMVSYNEWLLSVDYRREISQKLGLEFSDKLFHYVEEVGSSSFDPKKLAQEADLLGRWEGFSKNVGYLSLLDSEMLDLADEIFGDFSRTIRAKLPRVRGGVVWMTGLPASGKTTLAIELERWFMESHQIIVLDGDDVRKSPICSGLGFSKEDRNTNILRIGQMAEMLARSGAIVVVAAVSPYREARNKVREMVGNFIEVFVDCPLSVCQQRDPKMLYAMAASGQVKNMTGVGDPYEPPLCPEVVADTSREGVHEILTRVCDQMKSRNFFS